MILLRRLLGLVACWAVLAPTNGWAQTILNQELFGKSAAAAFQAQEAYGRWDDPETLRRVADIGYRLAGHSNFTDYPFSFYIVSMREPNAFALPGGQIFVTRGMIEMGLTDDELANLLGHEIAHVTHTHGMKMQRRANLLNILSQALMVGVIVAGSGSDSSRDVPYGRTPGGVSSTGDKIQGAAAASLILGELLLRSYSRDFEDEADEEGQRLVAAAGFDPSGSASLFTTMEQHLPQGRQYGYWRTHPFNEDRVRSARARGEYLKIQEPKEVSRYRAGSQAVLLAYDERDAKLPKSIEIEKLELFLDQSALTAWPVGETAERLRREHLARLVDEEIGKEELDRDFGKVESAYERERLEVVDLSPESVFVAELDEGLAELRRRRDEIYPKAVGVLEGGVFQTTFLERFLSNYPDSPHTAQVALHLARAYSRVRREGDAVERYLEAYQADPEGELGQQVLAGLRVLAPSVKDLAALQRLADECDDAELVALVSKRLDELADRYDELKNGADYLARFPDGRHSDVVHERLETLAEELYGEVILYQGVGDSLKAMDRINQILTYAPLSPAAERLRNRAVFEG